YVLESWPTSIMRSKGTAEGTKWAKFVEGSTEDVPAFGFHFEGRKRHRSGGADGDAEAEGGAKFLGEGAGGFGGRFDGEAEFCEGGALVDFHLILADFRESANDGVDGARVDID